jgi:hypothetical protein
MAKLFRPLPNEYMPKIDNLFVVEFPEHFNMPPYFIQSATKPRLINRKWWRGNKWENIEIRTLDPIGPSMTSAVVEFIDYCELNKPGLFSKNRELFEFTIKALDPTGVEVEKWVIGVKNLISVDFGKFDYTSKELQVIKILLEPSYCILC